jgi:hypothetical protein
VAKSKYDNNDPEQTNISRNPEGNGINLSVVSNPLLLKCEIARKIKNKYPLDN